MDWPTIVLKCFDTVGWVIPGKNRLRYKCDWWDVKPYSIDQVYTRQMQQLHHDDFTVTFRLNKYETSFTTDFTSYALDKQTNKQTDGLEHATYADRQSRRGWWKELTNHVLLHNWSCRDCYFSSSSLRALSVRGSVRSPSVGSRAPWGSACKPSPSLDRRRRLRPA